MSRQRWLLPMALLTLAGCAPGNVPPEQAQVVLSNARVTQVNGEDNFSVDFKFVRGRPDRGRQYRLVLISGSDEKYWVDNYWTEKKLSGTIEAEMSHHEASFEPSKYFEAHLEILTGQGNTDYKSISNVVTFGTPTAEDIIGGDGEPDPPPPRSAQPTIAQTPPSAMPNIPLTPPVGIGPRFPRSGVSPGGAPLSGLAPSQGAGPPSTTPLTSPPISSAVAAVNGTDTPLAGGKGGVPFRMGDASGRLVVGFRYAVGSWAGQPALRLLEPLCDRSASAREGEVIAREGYAVGGLKVATGAYVQGVQIVFLRVKADGTLDSADAYVSDWLGAPSEQPATVLDGGGQGVVGIHGRRAAILDAVGLVLKDGSTGKVE